MKFIYFLSFLLLITLTSFSQNFKIFKGDTVNRIDGKGLKQGIWFKFDKNNKVISEGRFRNGIRTGTFKSYTESGKLQAERMYDLDGKNSRMFVYYAGGKIRAKGKLIEEAKDSTWLYYNDLGTLVSQEYYAKGLKEGIWKNFYPESGKVLDEITYLKNRKNGLHKEYFENGHLKMESTLSDTTLVGATNMFHPNGKIWMKGNYSNGLQDGRWEIYKEDGSLE